MKIRLFLGVELLCYKKNQIDYYTLLEMAYILR